MKPNKLTAGVAAGAIILGGVVGITLATAANATPPGSFDQTTHLYGQINNNSLSGNQDLTTRDISLAVSPTSAAVGSAITVTVSSSNLIACNGPAAAAAAYGEEFDALINFNGTDYVLEGPQNTTSVPSSAYVAAPACNHSVFDAGWTISSAAGGSSATTNSAASTATTGLGTATFNRSTGDITQIAGLTAPATAGTYPVALEALNLNSTGTGAPYIGQTNLYDDFDEWINTDGTNSCFNSATCAGTPVGPGGSNNTATNNPGATNGTGSVYRNVTADYITPASDGVAVTAVGPTASATAQNTSTTAWSSPTVPTPLNAGPGGVPYVRANDVLNISGNNNWGSNSVNGALTTTSGIFVANNTNFAISLCPASSTAPFDTTQGCAPAVVAWGQPTGGGTIGTTGSQLNNFSLKLTSAESGNWDYWILKCDNPSTTTGSGLATTDQKSCVYTPNNKIASGGTGCTYNAAGASGASIANGTPCPAVTGYGPNAYTEVPVYFLGTRAITTSVSAVQTGHAFNVTGANWYPGETVTVKGGVPGATYAGLNVTNNAISCSNGTPTATLTTNKPPTFAAGSYVTVNGTTLYSGASNVSNAAVGTVTGTNVISMTKTQNGTTTTAGTFTMGLTINGTSFTVGPEQYNVSSAQLQSDITAASTAASVSGSPTYTVSSALATATRTITVTQASGTPTVAVTGTNVTAGYAPANVASSLTVPVANTFTVTPNYSSCTSNGAVAGGGADTSTSIVANPGTPSGVDTGSTIVASSTGTVSGTATLQDVSDTELYATGIGNSATPSQNYAEGGSFATSAFPTSCTADTGNVNTGSCSLQTQVNATVTAGNLSMQDLTPPTGWTASGTGSNNQGGTTVNLGSIATSVTGGTLHQTMNPITVTDSRGGTFGWSLSAVLTNFTGLAGHTIANSQVTYTSPSCTIDAGAPLSASGNVAGTTGQSFGGTVNLCTKDSTTNATTQSSGGVYDVEGTLTLAVPAFQAADVYGAVLTATLS